MNTENQVIEPTETAVDRFRRMIQILTYGGTVAQPVLEQLEKEVELETSSA